MPVTLLSSDIQNKVESKANSYLDGFVGNLLWAGSPMEVLRHGKLVFEVPVMCTLGGNYYKVGAIFIDVNTMEINLGISDSPATIKENTRNLAEMK